MTPEGRPEDLAAAWVVVCLAFVLAVFVVRRARRRRSAGRARGAMVLANAAVLFALVLALLTGTETWLRHGYDGTTWHANNNVSQAWFERHWRTNSLRYRDVEWSLPAEAREDRIVVIGDSFTAGYGVADPADRFADLLRARLTATRGHPVDLRNVATIGADTPREIETLRRVLPTWRPGRVVLGYTLNDVEYLLPDDVRDGFADPGARRGSLVRRSYLADLARSRYLLLDSDHAERYEAAIAAVHRDPVQFEHQARNLAELAELCAIQGARLDVVIFPLLSQWEDDAYPYDDWHDTVVAAWKRAGVRVLDLRAAYAGIDGDDLVVGAFDSHPNERAHRIAADAIWQTFFAPGD